MSVFHRAAPLALALLAAAPAFAQEQPTQRQFQQRRPPQQQRHPQQQQLGQPQQRPQEAQRHHGGNGAGIAAGVLGGIAAGALLGGVLSGQGAPAEQGYGAPVEGGQGYGGGCPSVRRPVYDAAGRFAGYQAVPSC